MSRTIVLLASAWLCISFIQITNAFNSPSPQVPSKIKTSYEKDINTRLHAQTVDSKGVPIDVPNSQTAYPQQPPHSGRHFLPTHAHDIKNERFISKIKRKLGFDRKKRRFMEGWYYRLTLTEDDIKESFAFIFSIEDPHTHSMNKKSSSPYTLSCAQVMGPRDEYLVQAEKSDTKFWAWKNSQGLGCTFEYNNDQDPSNEDTKAMSPENFRERVKTGFQMLPYTLQGKLVGHDGTKGGIHEGQGVPGDCSWDLQITPINGWGNSEVSKLKPQLSSAGWLASYPVFEPHWQITMAHATASGTVTWKDKTYTFKDQPFYAEKNWGGSFPLKWYWVQCNAFENEPNLAVTAGGGIRKLPFLGGKTEELGLVGVHYNNVFYEAVPWTGTMEWEVKEWGSWIFKGRCTSSLSDRLFEVELKATCDDDVPGIKLRAPTEKDGMAYFCRDSFYAKVTLSLYHLDYDSKTKSYVRSVDKPPIVDNAISYQGAVEVGGGPWWDTWKGKSDMKQPMKGMVKFPYFVRRSKDKITKTFQRNK